MSSRLHEEVLARRDGRPKAAALGLQRRAQRHEDQGVAAELRRLGDLQKVLRSEGEDRGEGLCGESGERHRKKGGEIHERHAKDEEKLKKSCENLVKSCESLVKSCEIARFEPRTRCPDGVLIAEEGLGRDEAWLQKL